jgi:hypothetical protein
MLARTIRSATTAVALAAMLGCALPARAAAPPKPAPTCGACQPIGVMTILVLYVGIVHAVDGLIP